MQESLSDAVTFELLHRSHFVVPESTAQESQPSIIVPQAKSVTGSEI